MRVPKPFRARLVNGSAARARRFSSVPAPVSMARPRSSLRDQIADTDPPPDASDQPIDHAKVARLQQALEDGTLVDVLAIAAKIVETGG